MTENGPDIEAPLMTWNLVWQVAFCVHNIAYQGRFAFADFDRLGLPDSFRSSFDFIDGYMLWLFPRMILESKFGDMLV